MEPTFRPPTRTFKPRRRRLGSRRSETHARLNPVFGLTETGPLIDLAQIFPGCRSVHLEIGSGNGDLASSYAHDHPDTGLIAVDVHRPGIARLLADIEEQSLANLRVVEGDALLFLRRLPDASVDEVWAFFPDPWPKNAQAHRRLVTTERLAMISRVLRPGGWLRLATDVASYAEQMRRVVSAAGCFDAIETVRPAWRCQTRFESDGRRAGREAVDLAARRI